MASSRCALAVLLSLTVVGLAGCEGAQAEREKAEDGKPAAVFKHRTVRKEAKIQFSSQTRMTDTLEKGVSTVSQNGRPGLRVTTFRLTYKNGVQTSRKLLKRTVVREPLPRITLRGTRVDPPTPSRSCDSNYSGCVPIASDVDCGSGDGPAYVDGSVRITGSDIYDLDADGDGYGCD